MQIKFPVPAPLKVLNLDLTKLNLAYLYDIRVGFRKSV